MEGKLKPIVAAFVLMTTGAMVPAFAQLPPTNMGKFIHQPGDNQYSVNTQLERHGTTYLDRTGPGGPVNVSRPSGGGNGSLAIAPRNRSTAINPMALLGSNTPKVDISLEPISADEPIEPPGFPPLPDRLQLPVQVGGGSWSGKSGGGGAGGAGGASSGGGSASAFTGVKQHYAHYKPGGFQQGASGGSVQGGGGGGSAEIDPDAIVGSNPVGGANPSRQPVAPGGSLGYYRCLPAEPIKVTRTSDTFNSNSGGGGAPSAPRYNGASSRDLAKLGPAPKLDDLQEQTGAPEAPHAAIVNQAVSQDLSLPDDEFVSRYGIKDTAGKRFARSVGNGIARGANRAARRATSVVGF